MKLRRLALGALATALLVPLAACGSMTGDDMSVEPMVGSAPDFARDGVEQTEQAVADASDPLSTERSVVREGAIALVSDDPEAAADKASAVVIALGGFVASQHIDHGDGATTATAHLQLSVPSDRIGTAFDQLSELGEVTSERHSETDVTAQRADLTARVAALETSVERLMELMAGATSTADLLEAESVLSERQQELDGLKAQLESLEDRVAQASITMTISSVTAFPGGGPSNFWDGLVAGWQSIVAAGGAGLVILGVLLPWLAVGAIIAGVIVVLVRRRKRAKARKLAGDS